MRLPTDASPNVQQAFRDLEQRLSKLERVKSELPDGAVSQDELNSLVRRLKALIERSDNQTIIESQVAGGWKRLPGAPGLPGKISQIIPSDRIQMGNTSLSDAILGNVKAIVSSDLDARLRIQNEAAPNTANVATVDLCTSTPVQIRTVFSISAGLTNITDAARTTFANFLVVDNAVFFNAIQIRGRTIILAPQALATNATDGFTYIPTCAGTPTGVPTAQTGTVPIIYDTTNNFFYIYNAGWRRIDPFYTKPSCIVTNSVDQVIPNFVTTLTQLTYNTEIDDTTATMHSTVTNTGRITIPRAGRYLLWANAIFQSNAVGLRAIELRKNGSTTPMLSDTSPAISGAGTPIIVSRHDVAAVNDFYEVFVAQTSGGNLNVQTLSNGPFFGAIHIGD